MYSCDMLGEEARTKADARRYHLACSAGIGLNVGAGEADRHVCVDTTAAGGNASLLARAEAC